MGIKKEFPMSFDGISHSSGAIDQAAAYAGAQTQLQTFNNEMIEQQYEQELTLDQLNQTNQIQTQQTQLDFGNFQNNQTQIDLSELQGA
jgi:hypothetical protein